MKGNFNSCFSIFGAYEPDVSIIMASRNCEKFIRHSIQSVLGQGFQNWELIISDDASTDGSSEIIRHFVNADPRIRSIFSVVNKGAASARNAALRVSRGRFIAFLDSDDLWVPQKLERQIAFMRRAGVAFSFTSYERIDEDGLPVGLVRAKSPVSYRQLLRGNVIGCLTAIYDSDVLGKVQMPEIAKRQDYGLWLDLLKKVDQAVPLTESLGYYRLRRSSMSANKANAALYTWRLLRDVERLPLPLAVYYFTCYALRGAWSHYGPRR